MEICDIVTKYHTHSHWWWGGRDIRCFQHFLIHVLLSFNSHDFLSIQPSLQQGNYYTRIYGIHCTSEQKCWDISINYSYSTVLVIQFQAFYHKQDCTFSTQIKHSNYYGNRYILYFTSVTENMRTFCYMSCKNCRE